MSHFYLTRFLSEPKNGDNTNNYSQNKTRHFVCPPELNYAWKDPEIQKSRNPGREAEILREGCRKISDGIGYECSENNRTKC